MFRNGFCGLPFRVRSPSRFNQHLKTSIFHSREYSVELKHVKEGFPELEDEKNGNDLYDAALNSALKTRSGQVQHSAASKMNFSPKNGKNSLLSNAFLDPSPVVINESRRYLELDDASLLNILATTDTPLDAWDAYVVLLERDERRDDGKTIISHYNYHRLAILLATIQPYTHEVFLRILSVLSNLKKAGGFIHLREWNLLIDRAGKGWRKVTPREYRVAIGIFKDLLATRDNCDASKKPLLEPDIITFTTLLNIAVKTLTPAVIDHALSLFHASGLPWTRMAHMALLPYYIKQGKLELIPKIVVAALSERLKIDTVNACIWAYAYHNKMEVALELYRHLRSNIPVEHLLVASSTTYRRSVAEENHPIFCIHGFAKQATMPPDEITYRSLIQALCYHGDLVTAVSILQDMTSTVNPILNSERVPFKPTMAVYRAIFLGFARHSGNTFHKPRKPWVQKKIRQKSPSDGPPLSDFIINSPWSLKNLDYIFEQFIKLEWTQNDLDPRLPSDRMLWWIFNAYARVTNGDATKMEFVWQELESRFTIGKGGSKPSNRTRELLAGIRKIRDEENEYGLKPKGCPEQKGYRDIY